MNLFAPVSRFMTTKPITVKASDSLLVVKQIFEEHKIHHIPVVKKNKLVGMLSDTDFMHFKRGFIEVKEGELTGDARFKKWKAADIMTTGLAFVDSIEPLRTVLEVFKVNHFHALPVVDHGKLVGIITTFDIIKALSEESVNLEDYKKAKEQ